MNHLRDLDVLVLGLGDSGLAMARWCVRHGARVQVWDSRPNPPQAAVLAAELPAVTLRSGTLGADDLGDFKLVLKSPGLAPHDARIVGLLQAARAIGIAVAGELDLFARALADLKADRGYAPAVLAITGTNGKTTTTAMTALLVQSCGKRVAMAGNIGPTMLDTLAAALDAEPVREAEPAAEAVAAAAELPLAVDEPAAAAEAAAVVDPAEAAVADEAVAAADATDVVDAAAEAAADAPADTPADDDEPAPLPIAPPPPAAPVFEVLPEVWVLELSSFQLDGVQGFAPSAAAVLNITQDHLDWHGDMAAYAAAKARIHGPAGVEGPTVMVVNRDDLQVEAMVPAPVVIKGGRGIKPRTLARKVLRFGLDAPQQPGDFGLVTENGMAWLVRARELDETLKRNSRKAAAEEVEIQLQRLMPADALRVRGRHNAANALAALALATAIGCALAPMLHALRDYAGEPHRVAYVATVGGVEAFDDSKGTNVGATVAALDGLGADKAPARLVVILGGDGKGQDFAPLAPGVARHARAVALIGRDAPAIASALAGVAGEGTALPLQQHDSLEAAVLWCFEQARPGDAVLLSPACASLDMFRNYAHRADVFVAAVQAEADARGEFTG
ncbi:UDP-N-acetylmuramoyl-L-alanine--D-glutamate ligase [Aquabacterium sp. OR-4]|uniref:UDP-N-acetylmuramoyl-L-alanine--D-glutamate ligase n=1 Tax=Aquabacterium sp. OR-4 TaxID=2978127 RepID=UPI0021B40A6C|nr:UDP-N-acetylmuramoyl-L-alanine--D-glutamate ligase [Aquabacterium sp. OR-4]MDT7837220.1 UDP-N-acetylmuramoyl-L-alanine--D-glutamate ligase [Aquabacterium sp. OR-4]